ncbi:MAG: ABC transporter ATP-binding protein [Alphaproteobacteria bacterium]
MAEIKLRNIGKVYPPDVVAVAGVDLDIGDGEFVVLLGPSGCGKSTTLRMIAGLEQATSGDLFIDGARLNDVDPADRDLAIVFQNYALYPHMTVAQNLAFGLKLRGVARPEIETRIRRTATMLGIGDLLGRKPRELSGGQQQRVALGRALVRQPKAFLFDEPLSNLDAKLRASMRTELIKLHQQLGATIVHVTHDQVEAMTMGQRICIMKDGRIVQVGPPMEVYRNPADIFVAGFLASPPMNLLEARLAAEGGLAVEIAGVRLAVPEDRRGAYQGHVGQTIVFGLRPEDIYDDPGTGARAPLDVRVVAVEALGPEIVLVAALADGREIAARLGREFTARVGAQQRLHLDLGQMHVFDRATGRAVARNSVIPAP